MKERLRSSQSSSRNEEPLQRSQYESPKKIPSSEREAEKEMHLGEEMQYKLQKLFQEAGNREQRYIGLIKEQEQRMKKQSQRYLQTLKEIKKQFLGFMAVSKSEKQIWRPVQSLQHFSSKAHQRLNSIQFSQKTIMQYAKQEGKTEPELNCKIHGYYYTPFAQDCLRFHIPDSLMLRVRGVFGGIVMQRQIQVIGEEDAADNLNCLLNRVPFQISTRQNEPVVFEFTIPCNSDAVSHYRRKQVQIQLVDSKGLFLSAYGKLNLKSLLYYQQRPTEWQLRPLPVFSPLDGSKVGELSLKLGNRLELRDRQDHYRVQSSTPMQLATIKAQVNYNDEESRMIQRISKFKSASNSLLLGIGTTRDARPEKIFEQQSDKTILMHRQKKELESVLQYKNSHKGELMEKLFNEAIERYYLTDCQVATPKMVYFNYRNNDSQHRKIIAKGKNDNAAALALAQQIQTSIIGPRQISFLHENGLISLQKQTHADYQFDQQEQSLWAISGIAHLLTVKVLCPPLKKSSLPALNAHYDLKLNLLDQYGQLVESFHSKLKLRMPIPQSTLYAHGYVQSQSQLQIPFDEEEGAVKKSILTDIPGLQHSWNPSFRKLSLRISHQFTGQRSYYLIINDQHSLFTITRYQIILTSYPRLAQSLSLQLGEVRKVTLDFMLTEQMLTQISKEEQNIPVSKPRTGKDQIRVLFASSRPQHCVVTCQDEPELICKLTKTYQVQAKIQTFDSVNPEKILVHAMDLDRNIILKRWLLLIQKESTQNFRQVFRLSCEHGKLLKYKFQLMNQDLKQKSFRFYSSNLSIMTIPQTLLVLVSNQRSGLELEFKVRHAMSTEDSLIPVKVILTVTDGAIFNNYLFELNVRTK